MARTMGEATSREDLLTLIELAAKSRQTFLDLSDRGIAELPNQIGKLVDLQIILLDNNRLTSLPESMCQLLNLQWLSLGDNLFNAFPPSIGNLPQLHELWLNGNRISQLPQTVAELANLQRIKLERNRLKTLPPSVATMRRLKVIYLEGNPLNPALQSAYDAGLDSLRAYLLSLEAPAKRELLHEAKLVL